ncbi:MAG: DNA gyrase inhibitor YacG, partial [Pseudomonadota bacterium]|nr:DNA gyrase inhibitor YacG [Pseudomonadota bacterium]
FCCRRCKEGDLGAWASGSYAVEAPAEDPRDPEAGDDTVS